MHGKWERKRKKKPWIAILVLIVAVILLALFFARGLWQRSEEQLPAEETITTDATEDTDSIVEPSETEGAETEPVKSDEQLEVVNAYVNEDNHLILVYSNGKEIDTGVADTSSDDTQEQFKVVFKDYSGTVLKEEFVNSGASATPPSVSARQGFVFVGWDGSYTVITADTTLVAMYAPISEDTVIYTVRFVDYDDVVLKTETVLEGAAATAPGNPLRKGYQFAGWDKPFNKVTGDLTVKAQYAEYSDPEIVVEDVEATAGSENVAVTLRLKNNPGIASLKFAVAFSEYLTLTKVEYNTELGGHNLMPQTMESPATLIWVNPFEDETGDWLFATLYFTVADNAEGTLPITVTYDPNDVYDMTETNIKFRVSNGAVIVP